MAQGFGGSSPGMSILIGVAQGVSNADKRKREMEQEAINARLKEQQITQMEENTRLNKEREQRLKETEIARQEQAATVRDEAEAQRAQQLEQKEMFTGLLAKQYMGEGADELTAYERAMMDIEGIDWDVADPDEEVSIRDQAFMDDRATAEALEADMERLWANKELRDQMMNGRTSMDAYGAVESFNEANGTDYSPEAARAVWEEVKKSALDPELDWGNFASLPVGAQRWATDEASVRAGKALLQAEEAIAKWHANNQPKEGEEPKSWDPYEIAQNIVANEIKGQLMYGALTGHPERQAVMDRMLFELERLRQNERNDDDDGDEEEVFEALKPANAPPTIPGAGS
jgi:hypothetical protein